MAHRSSAFKHIRADKRKRDVSFRRKSAIRTAVKKTRVAIEAGNVEEAESKERLELPDIKAEWFTVLVGCWE